MKVALIVSFIFFYIHSIVSTTKYRRRSNPDNLNHNNENYPDSTKEQIKFIEQIEKMTYKCLDNSNKNIPGINTDSTSSDLRHNILKMTLEEKLQAFKNSNCPPLIIVPGFLGSKLEFRMKDCKEFQKYHKNILETCGWNDCEAKELKKFKLWVNIEFELSDIFGMDMNRDRNQKVYIPSLIRKITFNKRDIEIKNKEQCLGNLLRVYFIKNQENSSDNSDFKIDFEVSNLKGAEVRLLSTTKHQCGSNIVSRILGEHIPSIRYFNAFSEINDFLLKMGYISGLSLFYRPYDFRMPHENILKEIDRTVKIAYQITKKKPVLIGHSLGGVLSYKYSLKKNKLIKEIMAIGSPFLGTSTSLNNIFELDHFKIEKKFNFFGIDINVSANLDEVTANMIRVTFPFYNFIPKAYINDEIDKEISKIRVVEKMINSNIYRNANELEKVENKIKHIVAMEENKFLSYLYKIFPEVYKADCNSLYINNKSSQSNPVCKINYEEISGSSLEIDNEEISTSSKIFWQKIREILKEPIIKTNKNLHEVFNIDPDEYINFISKKFDNEITEFTKYINPKVPFTFVYSNHLRTHKKFYYKEHSKIKTEYSSGDGTVNSISQIYPGLRWLYEKYLEEEKRQMDNSTTGNNSPSIHFIEYCADYKQAGVSNYEKKKTQYISISCDCLDQHNLKLDEECNHASMLSDTNLISFISEFIAKSDSKVEEVDGYEVLFDKKFNKDMVCSHLDLS